MCNVLSKEEIYNRPFRKPKVQFLVHKKNGDWDCVSYQGIGYTCEDFKAESSFYKNLLNDQNPNMGLYRELFNDYYNLSEKKVYILPTKENLEPFKEWSEGKSPEWWDVYRNLKHSRFQNRKKATLKIVLNALAALFLLNVYYVDNRPYLVNNGILRGNLNLRNYPNFFSSLEPINTLQPIIAKTDLFGYIWETTGHWAQYPWNILDPGNVYGL